MSSASSSSSPLPFLFEELAGSSTQDAAPSQEWKQEVSRIMETRRARRAERSPTAANDQPASSSAAQDRVARLESARTEAAQIAAAVAARYASVPSYSELLQQRAAQAAAAAAEMEAAATAHAAAEAFANESAANAALLREALATARSTADGFAPSNQLREYGDPCDYRENQELPFDSVADFQPPLAWEENLQTAKIVLPPLRSRSQQVNMQAPPAAPEPAMEDLLATSWMTPPVPLPANLIEFPREFVATRRVRPKLAEGPLGAASAAGAAQAQLRIFEVEPESLADPALRLPLQAGENSVHAADSVSGHANTAVSASEVADDPAAIKNDWSSICLGAHPDHDAAWDGFDSAQIELPLQPASLDRRLMAFTVDFCCVTGAFFSFLFIFALSTPQLPSGKSAVVMATAVYLALGLLYQYLFFSLSRTTPGMDYAQIAFCTFDNENPPRRALQRRIVAWWMSALPLGLGFLWALLDDDSLSWADRMTRMYCREY